MPTKKKPETDFNMYSLKFWSAAIKELGIPAFVVLFFTMMFLIFATKTQKEAFIDRFFLFQGVDKNPFPFAFVVLVLLATIILQYIYFRKIIRKQEEENKRLGEEKADLQQRLLNRRLNTSQPKK